MDNQSILEIVLKARDEASKTIEGMGKQLDYTVAKTKDLSAAFKAAGAVVTGVGIAGAATLIDWTKAAAGSQMEMAQVNASLANVHEAMSKQVVVVGAHVESVKSQTKEITNNNAALRLQMQSLRLSGSGHEEQIKSIQKAILANNEHALALKTSGGAVSTHTTIIKKHVETLEQLQQAVEKASRATIQLGFDDEESAAALVKNLGITKDMKQAKAMLNAEMELSRAKNIDLASAAQLVDRAYVLGGASLARQGIMIDKSAKGMDVVNAITAKYKGTVEATNKTADQAWKNTQLAIDNLKEELGARLLPVVTSVLLKFDALANKLLNMSPKMLDMIVKVVAFGTAFALVAGPILAIVGFLPAIGAGFAALAAVALPLTVILAAVAIGGVLLYKNWGQVTAAFNASKPQIQAVIAQLMQFWTSIQPQLAILTKTITTFITKIVKDITAWIKDNKEVFQAFWTDIVGLFNFSLGFILGFWKTTWAAALDVFMSLWQFLKGAAEIGWGLIQIVIAVGLGIFTGNWNKAWELIKKGWNTLWTGMGDFLKGWVDTIINTIKLMVDGVIGVINGLIGGANQVMSKIPGNKTQIPSIPKFEQGGFVPKTGLAILHEGEFVLSKNMLSGQQAAPSVVNQKTYKQPINIQATINQEFDLNLLGQKLAFAMRNSR